MKQLQELLVNRDEQIESMNQQIERLSQLLAVSHRSLQQVTDQSQLLIADNRKSSFWKRLFGPLIIERIVLLWTSHVGRRIVVIV